MSICTPDKVTLFTHIKRRAEMEKREREKRLIRHVQIDL